LLVLGDNFSILWVRLDTGAFESELLRICGTTNSRENCIKHIGAAVRERNHDLSRLGLLKLGRGHFTLELDTMLHHVFPNLLGTLAIESTQKNTADSDGNIQAKASQETRALETNVGCTNTQRLSGALFQAEHIVGRDGEIPAFTVQS
jgi:hypothetical protein